MKVIRMPMSNPDYVRYRDGEWHSFYVFKLLDFPIRESKTTVWKIQRGRSKYIAMTWGEHENN